jgi:saccharopine dehydrogenase (NAD+, L-lysine-forming)
MLYGAYGFTGELIAETAVQRGHDLLLAGRSEAKLTDIADRLELGKVVIDLDDKDILNESLEGVDLVFNAAGPFVRTAQPIVEACLETGTNYLDVCGEVPVFERIFSLGSLALERGIAIIPGAGFNVIASDCLARYVTEKIDETTGLEIATVWATEGTSPGSTKTLYENLPAGTLARRDGQLVEVKLRNLRRRQRFLDGEYTILPVTMGDLSSAYKTTQAANITTYTAFTDEAADSFSRMEPILRRLFSVTFVRRIASQRVGNFKPRTKDHFQGQKTSQVWVAARNEKGDECQAWLETMDSYIYTAEAGVRSVERVFSESQVGVMTPALAFGTDFALEIPGSKRADKLEQV